MSGQHTGSTDVALTAHGEDEARALYPWLRQVPFSRVLVSPMQRAQRTCALAGLGNMAELEPDLAEWDYGEFEGKTTAEIREERPDWNVFRDGCPSGETPAAISTRADHLIESLCTMDGNIALFSHGQFGLVLATRWIGLPVANGQHFTMGTASLGILGYNPAHPAIRAIVLWNDSPTRFSTTKD